MLFAFKAVLFRYSVPKRLFHKRLRAFQLALKRLFHKRFRAFQLALKGYLPNLVPDLSQDFSSDVERSDPSNTPPASEVSSAFWLGFWLKIFSTTNLTNLTNVRNNYSCDSHQARDPQNIASYALTVNTRKC